MEILQTLYWYIFAIPSLLVASTVHEYAHALTATKLGDYTAKASGRLSLNPLSHIDIVGALMMIVAGFGWSKPVPINEYNFDKPVLYTAFTAIAGPISNLILASLSALVYYFLPNNFLFVFIIINLSMAIFNLLPIPPLDGHKVTRALLPRKARYYWESIEKYAPFILLLFVLPFSPLSTITQTTISTVMNFFLKLYRII